MHVYTPLELEEAIRNLFPKPDQEINVVYVLLFVILKAITKSIDNSVQNYRFKNLM